MDGLTLLCEASEAYRKLETLAGEAIILTESGDEDSSQQSRQCVRFSYAAPNRIRFEHFGKQGMLQVPDGELLHTVFTSSRIWPGPRYSQTSIHAMPKLPHGFSSNFPFGSQEFLYHDITERAIEAQVLRKEDGCFVVSVTYEPPTHPMLIVRGSAILFWINEENRMVVRCEGEIGHRFPTEDEISWTRHIMIAQSLRINERLPEETFHFTPPEGADLEPGGRSGGFGGSGRFIENNPDDNRRLEHQGSQEGDTLVDRCNWKIRGVTLTFERRLTYTSDQQLRVEERIIGPKGNTEGSFTVPLK